MKPVHWIIAGLALVIVFLLMFDKGPENDNQAFKDVIHKLETEIKAVEANRATLFEQLKQDSISGARTNDSLRTRLNAKSREVVRLKVQASKQREEVQPLIDSVPALQAFVQTQDSTIAGLDSVIVIQDQRIAVYEHQLGKLQINMGAITQSFEQNLQLERDRFEASQSQVQSLEKENKKKTRQNKLLKIALPVVGVAAFLFGSQL